MPGVLFARQGVSPSWSYEGWRMFALSASIYQSSAMGKVLVAIEGHLDPIWRSTWVRWVWLSKTLQFLWLTWNKTCFHRSQCWTPPRRPWFVWQATMLRVKRWSPRMAMSSLSTGEKKEKKGKSNSLNENDSSCRILGVRNGPPVFLQHGLEGSSALWWDFSWISFEREIKNSFIYVRPARFSSS